MLGSALVGLVVTSYCRLLSALFVDAGQRCCHLASPSASDAVVARFSILSGGFDVLLTDQRNVVDMF